MFIHQYRFNWILKKDLTSCTSQPQAVRITNWQKIEFRSKIQIADQNKATITLFHDYEKLVHQIEFKDEMQQVETQANELTYQKRYGQKLIGYP